MTGYAPGEQRHEAGIVKLNSNENPYLPSPAVIRALTEIDPEQLRRYPPATAPKLQKAIAKLHNLDAGNVIITNGGDELLRLAMTTFIEQDEAIAFAEPSYSLYRTLAAIRGCRLLEFSLDENWAWPSDYAARLNEAGAKMCFVPNPHSPSGTLTDAGQLAQLAAEFQGLLLIDEAYVDFVDPALGYDCAPLVKAHDNVLILRTFSKGYSLAGARVAYGLGCLTLIEPMTSKTKDIYNVDFIAQSLALAALEDRSHAAAACAKVRRQRQVVMEALRGLGFEVPASQSNFLLAAVPPGKSAEAMYLALRERGVLVRFFPEPGMTNRLRITIGAEEENAALLEAIKSL